MASIGVIMLMKEHQARIKKRSKPIGHTAGMAVHKPLTNDQKNDESNHVIRTSMRLRVLTRAGQVHITYK